MKKSEEKDIESTQEKQGSSKKNKEEVTIEEVLEPMEEAKEEKEGEKLTDEKSSNQNAEDVEEKEESEEEKNFEISIGEVTLATSKQERQRKVKKLEEELEEPSQEEESRKEEEKEDEELYGGLKREEKEDEREDLYGTRPEDFYSSDSGEQKEGPYSSSGSSPYHAGIPDQDFYNTAGAAIYGASRSSGNGNGDFSYNPAQDKDNPEERDWIRGQRFTSGLEHKSKKAGKAKIDYGDKKRKNDNPLYKR